MNESLLEGLLNLPADRARRCGAAKEGLKMSKEVSDEEDAEPGVEMLKHLPKAQKTEVSKKTPENWQSDLVC